MATELLNRINSILGTQITILKRLNSLVDEVAEIRRALTAALSLTNVTSEMARETRERLYALEVDVTKYMGVEDG